MYHSISCPQCEAQFILSDERFNKSGGKIRCGRCRHKFRVELDLEDHSNMLADDDFESLENSIYDTEYLDYHSVSQDELLDNLDHLIDTKLLHSYDDHPSDLEHTTSTMQYATKTDRTLRWSSAILLVFSIIMSSTLLLLQLWHKGILNNYWDQKVTLASIKIDEQFGVALPKRRDLAQLILVSATNEDHPSNANLTLIKFSIHNRANFDQNLPWLELALSDEKGSILARRTIPPEQYIRGSKSANLIRARELKSITIELGAFPPEIYGYELRILNIL